MIFLRSIFNVLAFFSLFWLPWWGILMLGVIGVILFHNYAEVLALGILYDVLYGASFGASFVFFLPLLGTAVGAVLFASSRFFYSLLRNTSPLA